MDDDVDETAPWASDAVTSDSGMDVDDSEDDVSEAEDEGLPSTDFNWKKNMAEKAATEFITRQASKQDLWKMVYDQQHAVRARRQIRPHVPDRDRRPPARGTECRLRQGKGYRKPESGFVPRIRSDRVKSLSDSIPRNIRYLDASWNSMNSTSGISLHQLDSCRNQLDSSRNLKDSRRNLIDSSRHLMDSSRNLMDSRRNLMDSRRNLKDSSWHHMDSSRNLMDSRV
ncbi:unnamed protein product [Nesidiocoris tenuis]|uniref:Uncharacterized protein n=1 Tax=Nesidiocoris tenuis TaxID=355587 RepID=A0A6H5GQW8_9HEMI|nr:unnamed protein product [Nesidiocoris tenuis]